MITDVATGIELFPSITEVVNTYPTPADAYNAWANELGLDADSTLSGLLRSDDGSTEIDLGFITTIGGTSTKLMQSTEGSIAVWLNDDAGVINTARPITAITSEQSSVTRAYQSRSGNNPPIIFNFKNPTTDSGSWSPKWNKTQDTAIIYCEWASYSNQNANNSKVAIRIKQGSIEIVCMADSASTGSKFQIFMMDSSSTSGTAVANSNNFATALVPDVTRTFTSVILKNIRGNVTGTDGQPIDTIVRVYNRDTGRLAVEGVSDSQTGEYSLQVPDGEYYVVCLDGSVADDLNALILDRITPVE
ncbi:hypothetical protein GCM10009347_01540 [Shewanella algicola]|uniref:Uncharacterized protein n=1 Tax=Shewanella algicola TaxID=640633 RepID=A0A9X1Z316_9GAMM|nr:hypothetical protein [Shewanella algicola]MCL1103744.1 hypothetical protein [Shewanella algicola]GGP37270.1 hypothetical protein GCM10009347_01540 [Shewanella algicola]